jgi:hypothetical protein
MLKDVQLANATAVGPWPNHLSACGRRHARLHEGTDTMIILMYERDTCLK